MKYLLNSQEVSDILDHWANTPANSYRGSRYGENFSRLPFQTMSTDIADQLLDKIKGDIPLFANLNSDDLQVLSEDLGFDKKRIYIAVGNVVIPIATADTKNIEGDTFNANAQ